MIPSITLEEHYISEAVQSSVSVTKLALDKHPPAVRDNITELGAKRIAHMDEAGVALQVISHVPALETLDTCRKSNSQLAAAVSAFPTRFAGFAFLPMADPAAAADELERCVKDSGFVGTLIPNHAAGVYYDGAAYDVFWERAQQLDVPVYLHPSPPSETLRDHFRGNYPDEVVQLLSTQGWGWHADVALHVLRLYTSGLFDKFPRLKLVIGHMGEMLPFMTERIEARLTNNWGSRERGWMTVWNENLWITTSGMFTMGPFACLIRTVKIERILYSVDYPLEDNMDGRRFLDEVQKSGWLTEEQFKMFAYKNAEELLKVRLSDV
ncbi:2-amino-3-carboxymuconate-6-semialdehyde decarboxylase [Thozetella sp. PMI_491]|nr:2-amino-3-carboxymuconate-6-semialdehyde decarboxylase [Thozetella sp. PMI_491]